MYANVYFLYNKLILKHYILITLFLTTRPYIPPSKHAKHAGNMVVEADYITAETS